MKQISFESELFSRKFTLKNEQNNVGEIKDVDFFSRKTNAQLYDEKLSFESTGFWKRKINIYQEKDILVGNIEFDGWNRNPIMRLENETPLKFDKVDYVDIDWNVITEKDNQVNARIINKNWSNNGSMDIISANISNKMILTSLFLNRYYLKEKAIILVVLIVYLISFQL
jgi:hypothetical protein